MHDLSPLSRRVFCLGASALLACGSRRRFEAQTEWELAFEEPDWQVSGEGFAFGPADEDGVSMGLRVDNPRLRRGENLRYHLAFRNHGPKKLSRGVDSNRGGPRVHLVFRREDWSVGLVGPGVFWEPGSEAISMPVSVGTYLEPGETRARRGKPLPLDIEPGEVALYLRFGGRPHYDFERESGRVEVEVLP